RNADRHFLPVDRAHLHLRAEGRLRDVDRHLGDEVEPLPLVETVRLHLEGDQQVTRLSVARAVPTLSAQADLRAAVGAFPHRPHAGAMRATPPGAPAIRAALARDLPAAEARRTGTLPREPPRAERDGTAPAAFRACLQL